MAAVALQAHAREIKDVLGSIERNNIELKSLSAGNEAEAYDLKERNSLEAPSVEYSPFFSKGYSGVSSSELIVSQEFDFPSLYMARHKAEKVAAKDLTARYSLARKEVLLSAYLLCIDYIHNEKALRLLEQRMEVADSLMSMYDKKMKHGDATILDVNRIRMELMNLKTEKIGLESELGNISRELTALNGGESISLDALQYPEVSLADAPRLALLLEGDASVNAAAAGLATAESEVKVSRQEWMPKISVGYRRNTEMKESSNGFLVGVSLPLFSAGNKVKASKARAEQSRLNLDNEMLRARMVLETEAENLKSLRKSLESYDLSLLDSTLKLMRKAVDHGNLTVTDYYSEADKIYAKWSEYIRVENDFYKSAARLYSNEL